jgi:hypothetical protein
MSQDGNSKEVKLITRRRFLPWVITGVAGIGFSLSLVRELLGSGVLPPAPKFKELAPRFRRKATPQPLKHDRGFYLYSETNVVRYFPEAKTVRFNGDAARLQPIDPTQISIQHPEPTLPRSRVVKTRSVKRQPPPPRMAQSRVSFAFEHEAVSQINGKNLDRAFVLLTYAIQRELQLGYAPSFRLYDLLAGLCIRFERVDICNRMINQIQSSKNDEVRQAFDVRIKKWQDPQSRWYKRWSNRNKRIKWTVDDRTGLVLLT